DIHADKNVFVEAASEEDITSVSAAIAAGGSAGVGGSASVHILHPTTLAYLEDGATPADGVVVHARGSAVVSPGGDNDMHISSGTVPAGGTGSVGAAASISVVTKDTEAAVGKNADVNASGNFTAVLTKGGQSVRGVGVVAQNKDVFTSTGVSGGAGGAVSVN